MLISPMVPTISYVFYPNYAWYEDFIRKFYSPDIRIWPEETDGHPRYFFWGSAHLNSTQDGQSLRDRATSLKAIFDGAMAIVYDARPVEFYDAVFDDPRDPRRNWKDCVSGKVTAEPFCIEYMSMSTSEDLFTGNYVGRFIFLSRTDVLIRNLLKYIGFNGWTYTTLYACYEWMAVHGWQKNDIMTATDWSATQLKRFTATANNPAYLGPFCRHGGESTTLQNPMPLEEAKPAIRKAVMRLLVERLK